MQDMPSDLNSPVVMSRPLKHGNLEHGNWGDGGHRICCSLGASSLLPGGWIGMVVPLILALLLVHETYRRLQPTGFTSVEIEQAWELKPGDRIHGYAIGGGLGDVVIELMGAPLYMPMAGEVRPLNHHCSLFSSPELPAYRLRVCGLDWVKSGPLAEGDILGRGDRVALALLCRQPQGTWAMVEPATSVLKKFLRPSTP